MAEVISGVPHGSVIGPILFIIYVNGLPDRLSADSLLYADDVILIAPEITTIVSTILKTSPPTGPEIGS